MKKIGIVSLGCAKNLIDSEMMLGMFKDGDYIFTSSPEEADLIIINTCGFIESAKKEAIETILEMERYHKKLLVTGCLVTRYQKELEVEMPEVDCYSPISEYPSLHEKVKAMLDRDDIVQMDPLRRVVSTPSYSAYLRISDGCNNFCSFCAIPYIRGRFVSRPYEEIIKEAKTLKEEGIKEISIISQDTTMYGVDFPSKHPNIVDLLKELDDMGFYSIRLLYLYPGEISDELLNLIKDSKSIAHYFDIPIQCGSNHLLKKMNRHCTKEETIALFKKIKAMMPEAILRTTLISGFPDENDDDQKEIIEMMNEIRFDHLGDFIYSREKGTASYKYKNQVPEEIKEKRRDEILRLQKKISYSNNKKQIGKVMEGIVTGYDPFTHRYNLRSYWNAPDDIDGRIEFTSSRCLKEGDIVKVKITSAFIYDLMGEEVS
ncbi:MAG: 30S ribosomal protein S12 methylthiotransferase RimO [Bacilli bacterium]|nr:30S ribosomal protein S12 methylthiotransferase RimO [Bacilli bacterium]